MDPPKKMKLCDNCKREISEDAFLLHELHCRRKLVLCKVCNEPVPRAEFEEHNQKEHGPVACDLCGTTVVQHNMEKHKDEDCPQVKKECKYCELDIARGTYDEHVEGCGSRTDFCELCNQRVMLRDMQEHLENKCKMPTREEDTIHPLAAGSGLSNQDLVNTGVLPQHHGFNLSDLMMPRRGGRRSPPPSESRDQGSVHVDTQWLASVKEACGLDDDDLDQVLAQNLHANEGHARQFMHRRVSSSSSDNDTLLDRGGLTREHIERMEKEREDEELALRLHAQENSYRPAEVGGNERREHFLPANFESPPMAAASVLDQDRREPAGVPSGSGVDLNREDSGGGMSTEESDAEMARMIYNRDLEYVKNNPGIKNSGRDHWVDPEEMGGWKRDRSGSDHHARRSPDSVVGGGDHSGRDRPRSPDGARSRDDYSIIDNDARLARELEQREREYVEKLRVDKELAEQLQQAEDRSRHMNTEYEMAGTAHAGEMGGRDAVRRFEVTEEDRRVGERMGTHARQPQRGEGDLDVARRLLKNESSVYVRPSQETHSYNHSMLMNEEPRSKPQQVHRTEATEEEGKVPCQYCSELFPFSLIMDHQNVCSADTQTSVASMTSSIYSGIRQSMENREERVLTDEVLRQVDEEQRRGLYVKHDREMGACKFCREEMPVERLHGHEVVCPSNPDSRLNNVHHQRLAQSHPQLLPSPAPRNTARGGDANDTMAPCEKCKKLVSVYDLVYHESTCRGQADQHHASYASHAPQQVSNSHSKRSLAIRFPAQEGTPLSTTASHSQTTFSSTHSTASTLHSQNSHSTRPPAPLTSNLSGIDREKARRREQVLAHHSMQHSEPPLAVIGTSIGTTRPESPGGSRKKRTQEDMGTDTVDQHQSPVHHVRGTGGSHVLHKPPKAAGGGNVDSLELGRKPLHRGRDNGYSSHLH